MAKTNRPTGITVLAILSILGGLSLIVGGLAAGAIFSMFLGSSILGTFATAFGAVLAIVGIIYLVNAY